MPVSVQLSDHLVLRDATQSDRDALAELQAAAHAAADGTPNSGVATWTRDVFDRSYPLTSPVDITVVEDRRTGALVSSLTMIHQKWSYADVLFGVGRLELVATRPEYRRQGLIRAQMSVLHGVSDRHRDLMQAITDLMHFHGELGYHMALVQRAGRGGSVAELPRPPSFAAEPVSLRPARIYDIPTLVQIDRRARKRSLLCCPREAPLWDHELTGHSRESMVYDEIMVLERAARPVGYVVIGYGGIPSFPIPSWLPGLPCPEPALPLAGFELLPDESWTDIVPSVLRQLTRARHHDRYLLWLGTTHPAYEVFGERLTKQPPPMGWFLRIPDLAAFLHRIRPVLTQRLMRQLGAVTGTLRLHFYTHGLILRFTDGRLAGVDSWPGHNRRGSDASLPEQMFVQLLLGHADIRELAPAYPDFRLQTPEAEDLLAVLFPKRPSHIWPVI